MDEDNCVLHEGDVINIDHVFTQYALTCSLKSREQFTEMLDKIFLKIKKLNDLAKEKQK